MQPLLKFIISDYSTLKEIDVIFSMNLTCQVKVKVPPVPMAHGAAPISVSIALDHASANAVKATAGGLSTGSSASLTSPLLSHLSSARREGSEYHF